MTYLRCLDDCGYTPGIDSPFMDSAMNWLGESTLDQKRIESWVASHLDSLSVVAEDAVILHVGVGNSNFARRFCPLVRAVHGLTLGRREQALASSLQLENYQTWRVNKYHPQLLSYLDWVPYSFIVDNNLASYACCQKHFHAMLTNYSLMLREDGAILTDYIGMGHAPGDINWNIAAEIEDIAEKFGLRLTQETELVYALRKAGGEWQTTQ